MSKIIQFFREVRAEMAKVVWPNRRQLLLYTLAVIVASVGLAVFLGLCDLGFQTLLNKFILGQ